MCRARSDVTKADRPHVRLTISRGDRNAPQNNGENPQLYGVYQLSFIACKNRRTVRSFSERVLKLNRADSSLIIIVCVVRKEKIQSSISSSEIAFVTASSCGGLAQEA